MPYLLIRRDMVGHAYRLIARACPKYITMCCFRANQINIKLFEKRCTPGEILEINCLFEIEVQLTGKKFNIRYNILFFNNYKLKSVKECNIIYKLQRFIKTFMNRS